MLLLADIPAGSVTVAVIAIVRHLYSISRAGKAAEDAITAVVVLPMAVATWALS